MPKSQKVMGGHGMTSIQHCKEIIEIKKGIPNQILFKTKNDLRTQNTV